MMGTCFKRGGYGLGSLANHPLYGVPPLPTVGPTLGYPHLLPYNYGVVFTNEISGKSASESNHTLKGAPSINYIYIGHRLSSSDIVLFKLN